MRRNLSWCIGLAGLIASYGARADDPFSFLINITEADGTMYSISASGSNAEEMFDLLDEDNLRARAGPQFNGDEVVQGFLNFRGVPIELSFNNPDILGSTNGDDLVFRILELQLSESFESGGTRRQNIEEFKDFIQANEGDIVSRLYRLLAQRSSVDPIAGNPGSAQSQAAERDFNQGFGQRSSQVWGCSTSARSEMIMLARAGFACQAEVADGNFRMPIIEVAQLDGRATDAAAESLYDDYFDRIKRQRGENKATIGLQYAQISASDGNTELDSSLLSLPLSYTVVFDDNPKRKLIFRLPLALAQTEDADTVHVGLSVGYSHPMNERWSLTPGIGYSVVGSEDLGAASALSSFSLTSSYALSLGGWSLNIGNMIGSYGTEKFKVGDYESDPGISNTVITNGLMFSGPNSLLANDLVMEYFINDTRYSGDELFTDNAQEIGINLGRISTQGEIITSFLKAGVSYTMASGDGDAEVDVLRLSLVYKF